MDIRKRGIIIFKTLVSIFFFFISEINVPINAANIKRNKEAPLCIISLSDLYNPINIIISETKKLKAYKIYPIKESLINK